MIFAPGDTPPAGYLYIVRDGIALYRGDLLQRGGWWGEDMVLLSPTLRQDHQALAMTYLSIRAHRLEPLIVCCASLIVCDCVLTRLRCSSPRAWTAALHIDRETIMIIAERYPHTYRSIRRFICLLALRRHLVMRARNLFLTAPPEDALSAASTTYKLRRMLWRSTRCQETRPESRPLMLGREAQRMRGRSQLTKAMDGIAVQNERMSAMQTQLDSLASSVATIASKLGVGAAAQFTESVGKGTLDC